MSNFDLKVVDELDQEPSVSNNRKIRTLKLEDIFTRTSLPRQFNSINLEYPFDEQNSNS